MVFAVSALTMTQILISGSSPSSLVSFFLFLPKVTPKKKSVLYLFLPSTYIFTSLSKAQLFRITERSLSTSLALKTKC